MIHLDRLVSSLSLEGVYAGGKTTWTLPYSVATDGSEGELVAVSGDAASGHPYGEVLTTVRDSATEISVEGEDLTAYEVFIGVSYDFEYEFSRFYLRKDKTNAAAVADPRGKLQLRTLSLVCAETEDLEVTVEGSERTPTTYTFSTDSDDTFRVPVMSNNEQVTITLRNSSPNGARIFSASWEGFWHSRNRTR